MDFVKKYLTLSDLEHLRSDKTVSFKEETVDGVEVVIVSYMIANDELWKKPHGLEARGITFLKETGDLISLPFEKFFNINEKEHTQVSVVENLAKNSPYYVMEKRDGSMITPALINGGIYLKTKKSFFSDVAIEAQNSMPEALDNFCYELLTRNLCPIFEYTSPNNRVVIDYGSEKEFVLLAIRDMVTGYYLSYDEIRSRARPFSIPVVRIYAPTTPAFLMTEIDQYSCIEGFVLVVGNDRFKAKTKWYLDRHRVIDIRERDIARFVLEETLDDLMPNLIEAKADISRVREIEQQIADEIGNIWESIKILGSKAAEIVNMKDRAEWVSENAGPLAKFVHMTARGIEIADDRIREFYRQKCLSDFSLRSIGNPNFSGE